MIETNKCLLGRQTVEDVGSQLHAAVEPVHVHVSAASDGVFSKPFMHSLVTVSFTKYGAVSVFEAAIILLVYGMSLAAQPKSKPSVKVKQH